MAKTTGFLKALGILPLALWLCACSQLGIFNAVIPKDSASLVARDLAYGDDPRQKLDVYAPAAGVPAAGTLVFVYGGSWNSGSKSDYAFVGRAFASRGYTTFVFDYRLVPAVRYPAFVEDAAKAVAWAHRHAAEYGGDPRRLYLLGHSAGAYNAAMVALAPEFLAAEGLSPKILRAVAGLSGPYDFLPLAVDETREAFAGVKNLAHTQPINRVGRGETPPMFLATGAEDELVRPSNTSDLAARLRQAGHAAEDKIYPGVDHVGTLLAISRPLRDRAPVVDDVVGFFAAH